MPTPNLLALATRGAFYTDVQAAMPHTSKSLVSILCGRLPAMETPILEAAHGVTRHCLPARLGEAGYGTAFFQSAIGSFELRPRLTTELGFETFGAYETLGVPPLGYLAGDDRALPGALQSWLESLPPDQPFFATLLTSGTHHPYALPADRAADDPTDPSSRYAAMVALEDDVVGDALARLARLGRLDNTIVIALADHGEGLPGDPVMQHDNNFFADGLHVPLIVAGPGVTPGQRDGLQSLLDVTPLLLDTLGLASALPDDELRFGLPPGRARSVAPFACWNDGMCEGFVAQDHKLVDLVSDHDQIAFDRGGPRAESRARSPRDDELATLERVRQALLRTKLSRAPNLVAPPIRLPSGFVCGPGGSPCAHPSRPRGGFH